MARADTRGGEALERTPTPFTVMSPVKLPLLLKR